MKFTSTLIAIAVAALTAPLVGAIAINTLCVLVVCYVGRVR